MQVELAYIEKEHEDAYKEAIEEYRAVSQARVSKSSDVNGRNAIQALPRRQISNYFVQFRKVHSVVQLSIVLHCLILVFYRSI